MLLAKDFDLAGVSSGPQLFKKISTGLLPTSRRSIEVLSQVQRTLALSARPAGAARRGFTERKAAIYAPLEDRRRPKAGDREELSGSFFSANRRRRAFYQPLVAAADVRVYTDSARPPGVQARRCRRRAPR